MGTSASVKIGTVAYAFGKWSADIKTNLVKVTNFTGSGYQQVRPGVTSATLTIEGPYDEGNMPFTSGTAYTWILTYTGSVNLTCTAYIAGIKADIDVDGGQRVTITAESDASFTAAIV